MRLRAWLGVGVVVAFLLPSAGHPQDAGPAYGKGEIAALLGAGGGPGSGGAAAAYSADELVAILTPAPGRQSGRRGLKPGAGPAPGAPGSGVVPDLRVAFDFNSARITPGGRAQLDELGRAMRHGQLRSRRFVVSGHTDAVGEATFNERLSWLRAEAVVGYLQERFRIEALRLEPAGFGERALLDPSAPTAGVNRRVEVRTRS